MQASAACRMAELIFDFTTTATNSSFAPCECDESDNDRKSENTPSLYHETHRVDGGTVRVAAGILRPGSSWAAGSRVARQNPGRLGFGGEPYPARRQSIDVERCPIS